MYRERERERERDYRERDTSKAANNAATSGDPCHKMKSAYKTNYYCYYYLMIIANITILY